MQIHVARSGAVLGKFQSPDLFDLLANQTLLPSDLAWTEGLSEWVPLNQLLVSLESEQGLFINSHGTQTGPYSLKQLLQFVVDDQYRPSDMAWMKGEHSWLRLDELLVKLGVISSESLKEDETAATVQPPPSEPSLLGQDKLSDFFWVGIPSIVARIFPSLAKQMADGIFLAAWPALARFMPVLALFAGATQGAMHFDMSLTYLESFWVMLVFVALTSFSAGLGVWLVLGYFLGDAFFFTQKATDGSYPLLLFAALPISYLLLTKLLIALPAISSSLRRATIKSLEDSGLIFSFLLQGLLRGVLTFFWTQSLPTLMRPLHVWNPDLTDIPSFQASQEMAWLIAVFAAACGVLHVYLESEALRDERTRKYIAEADQVIRQQTLWFELPPAMLIPLQALLATYVLAGLLTSWNQALIICVCFAAFMWLKEGPLAILGDWLSFLTHIPILARLIAGMVGSGMLIAEIFAYLQSATHLALNDFSSLTVGIMISMFLMTLLAPEGLKKSKA